MPDTLLMTDLCVASDRPEVEDFRLAARAMDSCNRALDRMTSERKTTRRDVPLWVLEEEHRVYMLDVFHPTYLWYSEAFAAAWAVAPDAMGSIDRLYFPQPGAKK